MKNTLMCLLASLLLAAGLTACGGGQTNGTADNYGTNAGDAAGNGAGSSVNGADSSLNGTDGSVNGTEHYRGDSNQDGYDDGLVEDARDAVDDAGRSVRNAVDDAGRAIDRAF